MLGVAQRDVLKSHWSSSFSSSSSVGPPTSANRQHPFKINPGFLDVPFFQYSNNQTWLTPSLIIKALVDCVHGGGEIPHLNASVCMASEEVMAWPGAHAARALTLPHCKTSDCSAIYRLHLTDPEIQIEKHQYKKN